MLPGGGLEDCCSIRFLMMKEHLSLVFGLRKAEQLGCIGRKSLSRNSSCTSVLHRSAPTSQKGLGWMLDLLGSQLSMSYGRPMGTHLLRITSGIGQDHFFPSPFLAVSSSIGPHLARRL